MEMVDRFKSIFKGVRLEIDDLFLLESFQIAYLPGWVPEREFAAVLHAKPEIRRFLAARCPQIASFMDSLLAKYIGPYDAEDLIASGDIVVWTIADLLVYNKCPEVYDRLPFHQWDFSEITSIAELPGKVVIDAGSGTGRVALEAAGTAGLVYAVEPVSRLREYIRTRAIQKNIGNLYVVDGFLHSLPFPNGFADIIITSHALGWQLENELKELERVTKKGGTIIHCPGTAETDSDETTHKTLIGLPWDYAFSVYEEPDPPSGGSRLRKYWKRC
jgi:SAM-dependent methyltransferase